MGLNALGEVLRHYGLVVGSLAIFIGGLSLNLTPCVYPMIPVTLAFFSRQAAQSTRRTVGLAGCYILGLSLSYALLGAVAARTGALLGSSLQQPIVLVGLALMVVLLALSAFGLYELRPPQILVRRFGEATTGCGGAFIMGAILGLMAAPCVGPVLLSLLLVVSQLGNPLVGFWLFFVLGLGMGSPYLVLGIVANRLERLPKAGVWLVWVKQAFGMMLMGLAIYFLRPLLPSRLVSIMIVLLLLSAGVYLGWLFRVPSATRTFLIIRRFVGGALVVTSALLLWPKPAPVVSIHWIPYSDAAFEAARQRHQPILVDVYADWCLPCVELDHVTFRHPHVVQALSTMSTLRIDATREVSKDAEALLNQYHIFGVPTLLVFDRSGVERSELRIAGFINPEEMLQRLAQLQSLSK